MVIKRNYYFIMLLICTILLVGIYTFNFNAKDQKQPYKAGDDPNQVVQEKKIDSSDPELPDKVYTFLEPNDKLTFNSLYLHENYMYYIYIELVSPHNCSTMRITIWDPDGKQYNIFESNMFYNPEYGRYFEIPFGVEMAGGHKFEFYSESIVNFNMYIQIKQGPLCLHDKIDSQYHDDILFFEVTNFSDGQSIAHDIDLETDVSYKFYIGRVSAISIKESNLINLDFSIEDPTEPTPMEFIIYSNDLLANISSVTMFDFGTAMEGEYKIKMTIYSNVAHVNIAYAVVKDYQISDVVNVNKTTALGEDSNGIDILEQLSSDAISLPIEGIIAVIGFAGAMVCTAYVLFINQKKKADVSIPFNQKK